MRREQFEEDLSISRKALFDALTAYSEKYYDGNEEKCRVAGSCVEMLGMHAEESSRPFMLLMSAFATINEVVVGQSPIEYSFARQLLERFKGKSQKKELVDEGTSWVIEKLQKCSEEEEEEKPEKEKGCYYGKLVGKC